MPFGDDNDDVEIVLVTAEEGFCTEGGTMATSTSRIRKGRVVGVEEDELEKKVPADTFLMKKVDPGPFYSRYDGHPPDDLLRLLTGLRRHHAGAPCIFLTGDSSLDNKYWLFPGAQSASAVRRDKSSSIFTAAALNGYETVLGPRRMVRDLCYHLNKALYVENVPAFALNCAVEASTLASRVGGCIACCIPACPTLQDQDEIVAENIRREDVLLVSVGGNDIALMPSIFTVLFMLIMLITPWFLLCFIHPSVLYFRFLFQWKVERYVRRLTQRTKPSKIGVCMIYFPDERNVDSWANAALYGLCYCCRPQLLQHRIRMCFEQATSRISIPGTTVIPIALYEALDGKDTRDYLMRVEPSELGAIKMSELILAKLGFGKQESEGLGE